MADSTGVQTAFCPQCKVHWWPWPSPVQSSQALNCPDCKAVSTLDTPPLVDATVAGVSVTVGGSGA